MLRKGLPTQLQMVIEAEHGRPWRTVLLGLLDDGLKQEQIAERLEVTQQTISKWVRQVRDEAAETSEAVAV